jgi:thiol-disulfide isomerase/thioredoxin
MTRRTLLRTGWLTAAALGCGLATGVGRVTQAAEGPAVPTLAIGAMAPDFDLPGVDGQRHRLADFSAAKVLVIVFTANHCPTAQAYEERLQKLADDYKARGVALVAISPNDPKAVRLDELGYSDIGDAFEDMQLRARERAFSFPYLYDGETEAVSRQYGPAATPHVFVFDAARTLRFVGRVDDNENPAKVTVSDTRLAIEALLAGQPVPVEKTKVFGCSIKWSEKRAWVEEGLRRWAEEPVDLKPIDAAGLKALVNNADGAKLRLVNVWATWCGPCVVEFPELVTINRMYRNRSFETVTLTMNAVEQVDEALGFLKKQQAAMQNVFVRDGDAYKTIEAVDPAWSGALPYTILVAPGGKVLYRSEGLFESLKLRRAIVGWLGRYYHSQPPSATQ